MYKCMSTFAQDELTCTVFLFLALFSCGSYVTSSKLFNCCSRSSLPDLHCQSGVVFPSFVPFCLIIFWNVQSSLTCLCVKTVILTRRQVRLLSLQRHQDGSEAGIIAICLQGVSMKKQSFQQGDKLCCTFILSGGEGVCTSGCRQLSCHLLQVIKLTHVYFACFSFLLAFDNPCLLEPRYLFSQGIWFLCICTKPKFCHNNLCQQCTVHTCCYL